MIIEVPITLLATSWAAAEPHITRAMRFHPHMDAADVLTLLLGDRAALMVVTGQNDLIVGAYVLESVSYPSKKVAQIIALGGHIGAMEQHIDAVEEHLRAWCTQRGISTIAAHGRAGWCRELVRRGWRTQLTTLAWKDYAAPPTIHAERT